MGSSPHDTSNAMSNNLFITLVSVGAVVAFISSISYIAMRRKKSIADTEIPLQGLGRQQIRIQSSSSSNDYSYSSPTSTRTTKTDEPRFIPYPHYIDQRSKDNYIRNHPC